MDNQVSVSVITVCFQAEKQISKTIQSVCRQACSDMEYIIIDGKSADHTMDVARRYEKFFFRRGIRYQIVSEPDKGIYDAMNKGVLQARGKWLNFLNAGDYYAHKDALSVAVKAGNTACGIIYGDYIDNYHGLVKKILAKPLASLTEGMAFSHQSAFIQRQLLLDRPYDRSFRIAGDYDFFLDCYLKGIVFQHVAYPFAVFIRDGISSNGGMDVCLEELRAKQKNGLLSSTEFADRLNQIKNPGLRGKIRAGIKAALPESVFCIYSGMKYWKKGYRRLQHPDDAGRMEYECNHKNNPPHCS